MSHLSNEVVYRKPLILGVRIVRLGGRVIDRGSRQQEELEGNIQRLISSGDGGDRQLI